MGVQAMPGPPGGRSRRHSCSRSTLVRWKDLPTPARAKRQEGQPADIHARRQVHARRRSGGSSPDSRLVSVLLPAPFGPITACSSADAAALRVTPFTATRPPKRRVRPIASIAGGALTRQPPMHGATAAARARRAGRRSPVRPRGSTSTTNRMTTPSTKCWRSVTRLARPHPARLRTRSAPRIGPCSAPSAAEHDGKQTLRRAMPAQQLRVHERLRHGPHGARPPPRGTPAITKEASL